jgi:hypothetical protein
MGADPLNALYGVIKLDKVEVARTYTRAREGMHTHEKNQKNYQKSLTNAPICAIIPIVKDRKE